MRKFKKTYHGTVLISALLAAFMCIGAFAACTHGAIDENQNAAAPAETETVESLEIHGAELVTGDEWVDCYVPSINERTIAEVVFYEILTGIRTNEDIDDIESALFNVRIQIARENVYVDEDVPQDILIAEKERLRNLGYDVEVMQDRNAVCGLLSKDQILNFPPSADNAQLQYGIWLEPLDD